MPMCYLMLLYAARITLCRRSAKRNRLKNIESLVTFLSLRHVPSFDVREEIIEKGCTHKLGGSFLWARIPHPWNFRFDQSLRVEAMWFGTLTKWIAPELTRTCCAMRRVRASTSVYRIGDDQF